MPLPARGVIKEYGNVVSIKRFEKGLSFDFTQDMYPSRLLCVQGETTLTDASSTYYGFTLNEGVKLITPEGSEMSLHQGMYFSLPGPVKIQSAGKLVLFQRFGYRGLPLYGGPLESRGRLNYIDNCAASLLVPPARLGDPCLNLLTFPLQTKQSMHVHPTLRLGIVVEGKGSCHTKAGSTPLQPGDVFSIAPSIPHFFETTDSTLSVIAFHPDSDVGPTDSSHPMLSRTYLKF